MAENGKRVDEEWKRKVEEERRREAKETADEPHHAAPVIKPTFSFLVSSLVSQALVGLGQIANPITQKQEVSLEEAKFAIDTLQMLQDKTKGNLTDEEKRYVDSVLYDLRMRFLDMTG